MNSVSVYLLSSSSPSPSPSQESGTATISAGALTSNVIEAAHKAHAHVVVGVCNTIGAVGALLGGGLGNLISMYGLGARVWLLPQAR